MCDTDEESEDEKIRSSVNFFFLIARGVLTCDFRPQPRALSQNRLKITSGNPVLVNSYAGCGLCNHHAVPF
jgi:hypothetical protein